MRSAAGRCHHAEQRRSRAGSRAPTKSASDFTGTGPAGVDGSRPTRCREGRFRSASPSGCYHRVAGVHMAGPGASWFFRALCGTGAVTERGHVVSDVRSAPRPSPLTRVLWWSHAAPPRRAVARRQKTRQRCRRRGRQPRLDALARAPSHNLGKAVGQGGALNQHGRLGAQPLKETSIHLAQSAGVRLQEPRRPISRRRPPSRRARRARHGIQHVQGLAAALHRPVPHHARAHVRNTQNAEEPSFTQRQDSLQITAIPPT